MQFQREGETLSWKVEDDVPAQCIKLIRALERVKKFARAMHSNALHYII